MTALKSVPQTNIVLAAFLDWVLLSASLGLFSWDKFKHPDRSKQDELDYSVISLKAVDKYLNCLHENRPEQMGREW